jgi:hypothetical protein
MSEFVLPAWRGIEEAMQDVASFAHDKGREKAIGLLPDGRRVFESEGDEGRVELPTQFRGTKDMFILHSHPGLPTELSDADINSITGMHAAGNLAVCEQDGTVSWTTGMETQGLPDWLLVPKVEAFQERVRNACFEKIDPMVYLHEPWDHDDERYIVVAHLVNRLYVKSGFLLDYHLRQGEVELEVLDRWLPKLGIEVR